MSDKRRTVVLLSGGMDSAAALYYVKDAGDEVEALVLNYGQRHQVELRAAVRIAQEARVKCVVQRLPGVGELLSGSSALTDSEREMPHGHYESESMKATVVPNRNMIMLALAAGYALGQGAARVAYGAHSGDHAIYPDCRPEFASAMSAALNLCHYGDGVTLLAPFLRKTKAEIVTIGTELGVPFHLTWTCYDPQFVEDAQRGSQVRSDGHRGDWAHCGECGSCGERREAFELAGCEDPTDWV